MRPLCIGKIIKPFGLKGFLKVIFYVDDIKDLESFESFFIKDKTSLSGYREIVFTSIYSSNRFFNVKIKGCEDRTAADAFRGIEIFVDEAEVPELKGNVFYQKDLIGLDVFYRDEIFGKVVNLINVAGTLIFITKMLNGKELAIPFRNEYIVDVDIKGKKLVAKKLDFLL